MPGNRTSSALAVMNRCGAHGMSGVDAAQFSGGAWGIRAVTRAALHEDGQRRREAKSLLSLTRAVAWRGTDGRSTGAGRGRHTPGPVADATLCTVEAFRGAPRSS